MFSRIILRVILSALTLALLLVAWLGFTSSGLGFVLARVPGLSLGGDVKGRLFDTIELNQMQYRSEGVEFSISQLELDWQPLALLGRELKIVSLSVDGVIGETESSSQQTSSPGSDLNLPFKLVLEQLQINRINWSHDKAKLVEIDTLDFAGDLTDSNLDIKRMIILRAEESLTVGGTLDISLSATGKLGLEFSHRLKSTIGFSEAFIGSGTVQGVWQSLELKHSAAAPYGAQSITTIENVLSSDLSWQLNANLDNFLMPSKQGSEVTIGGDLSSQGTLALNTTKANFDISAKGQLYTLSLEANVEKDRVRLNQLAIGLREKTPSIALTGVIENYVALTNKASDKLNFSLNGEWQSLDFLSKVLDIDIPVSNGKLSLDGNLDDYAFKAQSSIQSSEFKQLEVILAGTGSANSLTADVMNVSGEGVILSSVAKLSTDGGQTSISLNKISGNLRGETVNGAAIIRLDGADIQVEQLELSVGGASLKGQGLLGNASNFEWAVNASDLSLVHANLSGSFISSGALKGQLSRPVVSADVSITQLRYKEWRLKSAQGNLKFGLASQSPWSGELRLMQLKLANRDWLNNANLTLSGSLEQHAVTVEGAFAEDVQTGLLWNGQYADKLLAFSGRINNLPAHASRHFIQALPFELIGDADTEFNGSYDFGDTLMLESSAKASNLIFKSKSANEPDVILSDLNIEFSARESVKLKLFAQLDDGGKLVCQATVADSLLSAKFNESQLDGLLQADYPNLNTLQALLPASINLEGKLMASAQIKSTIQAPELTLDASINEGLLKMPQQGIALEKMTIEVTSLSANRFRVAGSAQAGQGTINLDGNIDIANHKLPTSEIRLVANDALFINTPEIKAEGAADLQLNLIDNTLDISGTVVAKKADIKVGSTMSAVRESPDLVLQGLEPKESVLGLTMKLDIDLGDNTSISASGLTGRLVGKPSIKLDKKGLLTSVGEVKVVDGAFSIVGEKLKIDKGIASYAGGAIDNPRLSFEATKTIGTTRAGIAIEGNADSPELSLFSQPTFGDQDILALVFFEKPLDQLSSVDALKLVSIANALRGGNTDSKIDAITDKVADFLGVDKLDVSFDSEKDQRKLSVSSKINSRLDIGYAYNFISSLQALFLRYKINEHWSIQSSVDVESGADLRYRVERD